MTLSRELSVGFNSLYGQAKTTLSLRVITRTRNSDDDITETYTSSTVYGILMPIEDFYTEEDAGLLAVGTHIAFFKPDVSNVSVTNNVVKGSVVYNIKKVENAEVNGNVVYQMAVLEKRTS